MREFPNAHSERSALPPARIRPLGNNEKVTVPQRKRKQAAVWLAAWLDGCLEGAVVVRIHHAGEGDEAVRIAAVGVLQSQLVREAVVVVNGAHGGRLGPFAGSRRGEGDAQKTPIGIH